MYLSENLMWIVSNPVILINHPNTFCSDLDSGLYELYYIIKVLPIGWVRMVINAPTGKLTPITWPRLGSQYLLYEASCDIS